MQTKQANNYFLTSSLIGSFEFYQIGSRLSFIYAT